MPATYWKSQSSMVPRKAWLWDRAGSLRQPPVDRDQHQASHMAKRRRASSPGGRVR